ncbi:hypothetical protein [Shinella sumterensis]|uniref:Uncharacterized protein n=1 Tax=Shinella sumterensis TaxID=1967501 RepID=A0AA50CGC5_9HYPH|nr:hypothetical protein [Shinella sumterensis]WLR95940.1 hypothetical protein Q9313_09290 [Shinella sumterensis]
MVDAVSLSGNSYRAATQALALRPAAPAGETRPVAPAPAVAQPSETVDDTGFLYAANGLPTVAAASADTVERSASADTARHTPAPLAIQSADLNALMSSFLTARTADDGETSPRTVNQSMIARLYSQF